MQVNDIITEFNGQPVQDSNDLISKVASTKVGESVLITFLRDVDGRLDRRTVTATLGDRSEFLARDVDNSAKEKSEAPKNGARLGLTLTELTPQLVAEKHLEGVKGLYVKDVDPNGLAAEVRPDEIKIAEVITRVNRIPVTTLAEFQRVIDSLKPGDAVVLNLSSYARGPDPRVISRIVQFTYQ